VLRSFECLGGCGWAPVVAVDWRYWHHVKPEDVPEILEAARRGRAGPT
jgi:NADH:ubiquinone oxidoreductase subunit E